MISIYKTTDNQIQELNTIVEGCWVNLVKPTLNEINYISKTFNIEQNHLKSVLDEEERARIEIEKDYILIIVDVPYMEVIEGSEIYQTLPMAIVICENTIITVCLKELPIFSDFINKKVKEFYTTKKTRFILQILFKISTFYLNYLRMIDKKSNEIERELHKSLKNKELIQLLDLEKSLVYFTTSLKSNESVLEKMLRLDAVKQYPDDKDLLEDVIIENKQAIEMAEIYSGILSGTMDAFASVISNNLNIVMKRLTSITIILSIPTMIASFFGMNVIMPFNNNPYAFIFVLIISFTISTILGYIMLRKKMF